MYQLYFGACRVGGRIWVEANEIIAVTAPTECQISGAALGFYSFAEEICPSKRGGCIDNSFCCAWIQPIPSVFNLTGCSRGSARRLFACQYEAYWG